MERNGMGVSNIPRMGWYSMGGSRGYDYDGCSNDNYHYHDDACSNDYNNDYHCRPYDYNNDYHCRSYDYGCAYNNWSPSMLRLYYCLVGRCHVFMRWHNELRVLDGWMSWMYR
jgi:hypothetical protein